MKFSDMMIISEAAQGYRGGYYGGYDYNPEMTLDECVHSLNMELLESQAESYAEMNEQNEMLVEATVNAIRYGSTPDFDSILEGAFENFKTKVKKFFERIKKWLQSIIAKLKVMIDKIRMNGTQLWSKYGESVSSKNLSKIEAFNGYIFNVSAVSGFVTDSSDDKIKELIGKSVDANKIPAPNTLSVDFTVTDDGKGDKVDQTSSDALKALTTSQSSDRIVRAARELVGSSLSGKVTKEGWKSSVREAIYGPKKEIKFNSGDYSVGTIKSILEQDSKVELSNIEAEYETMLDAVHKIEDEYNKELDNIKDREDKPFKDVNTTSGNDLADNKKFNTDEKKERGIKEFKVKYYNAYIAALSDVLTAINDVKAIKQSFYKDRFKQATSMLGKMISYNEKKNNNDSSESYELDVIDFDL